MFIDPDGRETRVHYDDKKYIVYTPGMSYDGDNSFVSTIINTLNEIHSHDYGQIVLSALTGEDSQIYSIINEYGSVENSWEFSRQEGGAIIKAAQIFDGTDLSNLRDLSHEIFHGYQMEMGQNPFSIDSEIGATLFGKSISSHLEGVLPGQKPQSTFEYNDAMLQLLLFSPEFNHDASVQFQRAVNNFKKGSSRNIDGVYNHLPVENLRNPLISRFFPLIP